MSEEEEVTAKTPGKGILQMKFMQNALAREKAEFAELQNQMDVEENERIRKLKKAAKLDNGEEPSDDDEPTPRKDEKVLVGKKSFDPKRTPKGPKAAQGDDDDDNKKMEFVGQQLEELVFGSGFQSKIADPIKVRSRHSAPESSSSEPSSEDEMEVPNEFDVPEFPTLDTKQGQPGGYSVVNKLAVRMCIFVSLVLYFIA